MAWLFVQLKLRLLRNALRSSRPPRPGSWSARSSRAGGGRHLRGPGRAARPERVGGPDHGHLHRVRLRLADPAAPGLRPGRHPGSGHAGALSAAHPPARDRAAGRLGHRRLAAGQPARPARRDGRAGPRRPRRARRGGRGAAAGAVLHHAGPVRDHQHGRAAALPPRQGPRRFPDHPDLRLVRVLRPGRAQGGRRGQDHRGQLRRRRLVAALAAARPGRARDPGRFDRPPRRRAAAPGPAGRGHRRARRAVDPVPGPRPGHRRHQHAVLGGARRGAAVRPGWPARHGGRPVLDLPAPRTRRRSSAGASSPSSCSPRP